MHRPDPRIHWRPVKRGIERKDLEFLELILRGERFPGLALELALWHMGHRSVRPANRCPPLGHYPVWHYCIEHGEAYPDTAEAIERHRRCRAAIHVPVYEARPTRLKGACLVLRGGSAVTGRPEDGDPSAARTEQTPPETAVSTRPGPGRNSRDGKEDPMSKRTRRTHRKKTPRNRWPRSTRAARVNDRPAAKGRSLDPPITDVDDIACKLKTPVLRAAVRHVLAQMADAHPEDADWLLKRIIQIEPLWVKRKESQGSLRGMRTLGQWKLPPWTPYRLRFVMPGWLQVRDEAMAFDTACAVVAHECGHAVTRRRDYEERQSINRVCRREASEACANHYVRKWGFGRQLARAEEHGLVVITMPEPQVPCRLRGYK